MGDITGARAALDEAKELADEFEPGLLAMVSQYEADVSLASGDFDGAIAANIRFLAEEFEYAAWSVAAIAVAFAQLGKASAALELGTVALMIARDHGADVRVLVQAGEDVDAAMGRARAMLSLADAAAAERAGRRVAAGQRLARVREVALQHLASRVSAPMPADE